MSEHWTSKILDEEDRKSFQKIWDAGIGISVAGEDFRVVLDPDGLCGMAVATKRTFLGYLQRVLDTSWFLVFEDKFDKRKAIYIERDPDSHKRLDDLVLQELANKGIADISCLRREILTEETRAILADKIIGNSPGITEAVSKIRMAARANRGTVLFYGRSGVGKESAAQLLHAESPRCHGPFVTVNCASIPDTLIESELFGHEKGAFTDAKSAKPGYFELADGGTIFLDEVGDLSLMAQAKILRALATKKVQRIGGTHELNIDVRVVAATNKDLFSAVQEGTFREDLYYRLAVVDITIPPLCQRKEDIPLIVEHLLRILKDEIGITQDHVVSDEAMAYLARYDWPGNIRELRNAIERAVILYPNEPEFTAKCFQHILLDIPSVAEEGPTAALDLSLEAAEKRHMKKVLMDCRGNKSRAAELLGISRHTLRMKLEGESSKEKKD